jgi:hypothetical protein
MPHISKRRKAFLAKVDPRKTYAAVEAINLVKQTATAKFDEAVDVAINLGIDAKKGDQTGARLGGAPRGHRQEGAHSRCSRRATRLRQPRPPAPTWSAWKISPSRSRRARSTSTW